MDTTPDIQLTAEALQALREFPRLKTLIEATDGFLETQIRVHGQYGRLIAEAIREHTPSAQRLTFGSDGDRLYAVIDEDYYITPDDDEIVKMLQLFFITMGTTPIACIDITSGDFVEPDLGEQ